MVAISIAYRLNVTVCPFIIVFHMIITELLAIRQIFWMTKWSIMHFQTMEM